MSLKMSEIGRDVNAVSINAPNYLYLRKTRKILKEQRKGKLLSFGLGNMISIHNR